MLNKLIYRLSDFFGIQELRRGLIELFERIANGDMNDGSRHLQPIKVERERQASKYDD